MFGRNVEHRSDVLRRSAAVFDVILVYTVCVNDDMSAHTWSLCPVSIAKLGPLADRCVLHKCYCLENAIEHEISLILTQLFLFDSSETNSKWRLLLKCFSPTSYQLWRAEESHDRLLCKKVPGGCVYWTNKVKWRCQRVCSDSPVLRDPVRLPAACSGFGVQCSWGRLIGQLLSGRKHRVSLVGCLLESLLTKLCVVPAFVALSWAASAGTDQSAVIACRWISSVARATLIGARDTCHTPPP